MAFICSSRPTCGPTVLLIEGVEGPQESALIDDARVGRRHARHGADLIHVREESDLGALVDDARREIGVVLLRRFVRALGVRVGGIKQVEEAGPGRDSSGRSCSDRLPRD